MKRRDLLKTLVALGVPMSGWAGYELFNSQNIHSEHERLVSALGSKQQGYGFIAADPEQQKFAKVLSGFRGHGLSQHPLNPGQVLMFARRPGNFGIVVDVLKNEPVTRFHVAENRFFYGHGCFSPDGKTLFTTEGDSSTGQGRIGIRDSRTYQQLGEFDTFGVGPHDVKLLPDGKTLVLANGGILTLPQKGRDKLNLPTMTSSLIYMDLETGQKIDEFRVPESKASIRHLDVADDGTVAIAMQVQREATGHNRVVPLGAIHKPGENIKLLDHPEQFVAGMNDYMGSVAINNTHRIAGFTSPRGNLVGFWHLDTQEFKGYHKLKNVCGIATSQDQSHFLISNSLGQVRELDALTLQENTSRRWVNRNNAWDNHMLTVKV
ncbi:DUF1513 domain-containing protein [Thiomicrorhabdus sp.]|uniref:DUF1513 domain-containing protein n=1 Tax=Thiomicrorhabdus sp. TaxID=2039724 RepID=UPI0029C8C7A3|nr:DUF1513 domain-containing protein [Thiomicrorhabdus sp.]